ncbi:SUF system NifU family Fe-S cluster assembly protein [Candidatus Legionella polyplacis]|uniref:Fe-S cluster assembly sulfur transfer protein SufU n=1 Tax=Candidatus Legionella polyplacis TaxID=2005262 RepID=UPI000C1F2AD4|nr:SUF system NifU family Fe-S cluster assembly protein [Candidatus Legionella polyplacis]ATW01844.1 SUF system NifU family Fe-S cluster assembly protein [Candidatus Legionella polyplacis]
MKNLSELYHEMIMDHNKYPHNYYEMVNYDIKVKGYNPFCGDSLMIYLKFFKSNQKVIEKISFLGIGCAISKASASLMTDLVLKKSIFQAHKLFNTVYNMLINRIIDKEIPGKLAVLSGIKYHPSRIKCAILAWNALNKILIDRMSL